ncbi:sodium/potassium/calcium exchanger 3-like [Antedon mediterranea]|uniref:sodium/potassium/calcium exchanger 3-like n=1 Tax=Antedon mediterranea TaxID=105859 RepID=UPI003AF6CBDF
MDDIHVGARPRWFPRRRRHQGAAVASSAAGKRWLLRMTITLAVFFTSSIACAKLVSSSQYQHEESTYFSRQLLSTSENSTANVAVWEQCDYETEHFPYLFVIFYALLILVLFIALAIICDDFFVPSLEAISEKLELSEDVAGATFMAAGSSAPELFTSIAGVSVDSDVGVGTIVGSAVFNILIIIALTAVLAGKVLNLDWRPLIRDSTFYGISVVLFIAFSWDGVFEIWEAIILLVMYALYIAIMKFNGTLMDAMDRLTCLVCRHPEVSPLDGGSITTAIEGQLPKEDSVIILSAKNQPPLTRDSTLSGASLSASQSNKHIFHHVKHGELSSNFTKRHSLVPTAHVLPMAQEATPAEDASADSKKEDEEPTLKPLPCLPSINMYYPDTNVRKETCGNMFYALKWLMFIVSFPFMCLFSWTIPPCNEEHNRKWYLVSFLMSILWIAILSFGMVTLVAKTGCILEVDHYTMGLVVVAVGTSVPDALSSILVARDGFADMAVSNAIGSNVFDINLGLGLPFLIKILIDQGPMQLISDAEMVMLQNGEILITPHAKFGFALLLILFMTLIVFFGVRFRLNKFVGISFVLMYILFMIYAFVQELVCDYDC